jgi:hypothetical protein
MMGAWSHLQAADKQAKSLVAQYAANTVLSSLDDTRTTKMELATSSNGAFRLRIIVSSN